MLDKFLVIDLDMDLRSARADFERKYLVAQINNFNGNDLMWCEYESYNFGIGYFLE